MEGLLIISDQNKATRILRPVDLRVNDVVLYDDNVFIDDEYESRKDLVDYVIANGEDIDLAIEGCFSAKPIDTDFLIDNGFTESEDLYTKSFGGYYIQLKYPTYESGGYWELCVKNQFCGATFKKLVNDIHETQHIISDAEIDMEFVIGKEDVHGER
jgi:hypothetical protein